jgi:hypothetical protein
MTVVCQSMTIICLSFILTICQSIKATRKGYSARVKQLQNETLLFKNYHDKNISKNQIMTAMTANEFCKSKISMSCCCGGGDDIIFLSILLY